MFYTPVARTKFLISTAFCSVIGLIVFLVLRTYSILPASPPAPATLSAQPLPPVASPLSFVSTPDPKPVEAPVVDINSMRLNHRVKHPVAFLFEGTATCGRSSCKEGRIAVRVQLADHTEVRAGAIEASGHYALTVPLLANADDSVEWMIEAVAEDSRLERTGRGIVNGEDSVVHVTETLSLLPTLQIPRLSMKPEDR